MNFKLINRWRYSQHFGEAHPTDHNACYFSLFIDIFQKVVISFFEKGKDMQYEEPIESSASIGTAQHGQCMR
jgi:hypothetical protein